MADNGSRPNFGLEVINFSDKILDREGPLLDSSFDGLYDASLEFTSSRNALRSVSSCLSCELRSEIEFFLLAFNSLIFCSHSNTCWPLASKEVINIPDKRLRASQLITSLYSIP